MPRFPESLLIIASSVAAVGSVVALAVFRAVPSPLAAYSSLACDEDGVCVPPDGAMPSVIVGSLAPIAFAAGLLGLLAALVLRVAESRWPPLVSTGAPAEAGPSRDLAAASAAPRRASSSDPLARYRPPRGDG